MNKILLLLIVICTSQLVSSQIKINEASNVNGTTLVLPDQSSPDWIELYNPGSTALNLEGYTLTDDFLEPFKWVFPAVTVNAGGFLTVYATGISKTEVVNHWETAVWANQTWQYLIPSGEIANNWKNVPFTASGWSSGQMGIGYGDGDDVTNLPAPTTTAYARIEFNVSDTSKIASALLDLDFDDGFVAYINGIEVARFGLSGTPPAWNDLSADHEALLYQGGALTSFTLSKELLSQVLRNGNNVLAFEVHNSSTTSSDMSLLSFLTFGFKDGQQYYAGTTYPSFVYSGVSEGLSTNFSIGTMGESIYVFNPSGYLVDSLYVPLMQPDMSAGKFTDGLEPTRIFSTPTPGQSNNFATNYAGFELAPTIVTTGGMFTSTQYVTVQNNSTTGGILRFTTNGLDPVTTSPQYTGTLTLSSNCVLKVRCFSSNPEMLPSTMDAETFLFFVDHTLPVISLSTNPTNLYGATGIFDNYNTDWRKPCIIEYFDADGAKQFETRASVKPDGGAGGSRSNPQHSVTVEPGNSLYGTGNSVQYPLIPEKGYIQEYDAFYLRNGSNLWNNYPQKDATFMRMMRKSHVNSQAYSPVVVYVNGEYFGVYELREKANKHYFESNYGNNPDNLDLLSVSYFYGAGILRTVQGSDTGFYNMRNFVSTYDPNSPDYFEKCHQKIDLYSFVDYMAAENWFANVDWIYNNMKIFRTQSTDNKWRFNLQDLELGLGIWTDFSSNIFDFLRYNNQPNPYWDIYNGLLQNTKFKNYFVNRYADLMNSTFQHNTYAPIVNEMYEQLIPEMPQQFERWTGDPVGGMATYAGTHANLLYQLDNRNSVVRNQIISEFGLQEQVYVKVDVEPTGAGYIKISTLTPEDLPWTGIYFDGVPVKITVVANPGFTFTGWEPNGIIPTGNLTDLSVEYNIPNDATFRALFNGTPAPTELTISEIHYNPDASVDGGNWIELHNYGTGDIPLTGWSVKSKNFYDKYEFEDGTTLPAGGYLVVCQDTNLFKAVYPNVSNFTGATGFSWSNKQDSIQIYGQYGQLVLSTVYRDEAPFPRCADGYGRTLENSHTSNAILDSATWFCGCIGGSPGVAYSPCDEPVAFTEINYNSIAASYSAGDWIEIKNNSNAVIDLTGYVFKDSKNDHVYDFPSMTLAPNAYYVISNDLLLFGNRHPEVQNVSGPFAFSLGGTDALRLYDATGMLIGSVVYDQTTPWPTSPAVEDYTLEYADSGYYINPNVPTSWFAGCLGGSPGRAFTPCDLVSFEGNAILYPNPTNSSINVAFENSNNSSGKTILQVFDTRGRLVYDLTATSTDPVVEVEIDASQLGNGMYYLRITQAEIVEQLPFVKF